MSLINVFLCPSRALIGVDTEGINHATGQFVTASKLVHLPHGNTILAVRGLQAFLLMMYAATTEAAMQGKGGDFDALAKVMPNLFETSYKGMRTQQTEGMDRSLLDSQQIVMAGWSSMRNRMRAICYSKSAPDAALEAVEIEDPGYMMPWNDSWGEPPQGDGNSGMRALALAQTRRTKQESPATAMGGRLMLVELTQHGMHFHSPCDLPARQEHRASDRTVTYSQEDLRRMEIAQATGHPKV